MGTARRAEREGQLSRRQDLCRKNRLAFVTETLWRRQLAKYFLLGGGEEMIEGRRASRASTETAAAARP